MDDLNLAVGPSGKHLDRSRKFWLDPEEVTLPSSGLRVWLCPPTGELFREIYSHWPTEIKEEFRLHAMSGDLEGRSFQYVKFIESEIRGFIMEAFIQASLARNSGPKVIRLDTIDLNFVIEHFLGCETRVAERDAPVRLQ